MANDAPLSLRHTEQWQWVKAVTLSISNLIPPQTQLPLIMVSSINCKQEPANVCASRIKNEYNHAMDVTLHIPDEFARRLTATGGDLSRRALEALALDEYKLGHLSTGELRRVLGFATRAALDGFLKTHGVNINYTLDDLKLDRQNLSRLGF